MEFLNFVNCQNITVGNLSAFEHNPHSILFRI